MPIDPVTGVLIGAGINKLLNWNKCAECGEKFAWGMGYVQRNCCQAKLCSDLCFTKRLTPDGRCKHCGGKD